ncbi:MAG: hypothetical protein NC218_08320 [Acetobacter sp.]|nr:hypothetical protein [Acetobacter sp.]
MAEFNYYLNRQGPRGMQGPEGPEGFSPVVTVEEDSLNAYILRIQTKSDTFLTTNLRGNVTDLGGTYIRYNRETGTMYAGSADLASEEQAGIVKLASEQDVTNLEQGVTISPLQVKGMIDALDLPNKYVTVDTDQEISGNKDFHMGGGRLIIQRLYGNASLTTSPYLQAYTNTITLGNSDTNSVNLGNITSPRGSVNFYVDKLFRHYRDGAGNHTTEVVDGDNFREIIPGATNTQTGLVKPDGTTITVDTDGTLHGANTYELPIASSTTLGGVKVGKGLKVDIDGVLTTSGGGSDTPDKYGIRGDYSTHYGILDCPNGLIDYNAEGKAIKVNAGIVYQAPDRTTKTTIASDLNYTLTTTGDITLFYGGSQFIEATNVEFSEDEPGADGADGYQAWYKPSEKKWYFRSNDTGNVFRSIDGVTPLANIRTNEANVVRVDYIGYRILDDDIIPQLSDIENLQELISKMQDTIQALENRVAALEEEVNGGGANGPDTPTIRGVRISIENNSSPNINILGKVNESYKNEVSD